MVQQSACTLPGLQGHPASLRPVGMHLSCHDPALFLDLQRLSYAGMTTFAVGFVSLIKSRLAVNKQICRLYVHDVNDQTQCPGWYAGCGFAPAAEAGCIADDMPPLRPD